MPDTSTILDMLGNLLNANGLIVYCGVVALFIVVELALVREEGHKRPSGRHAFTNFMLLGAGMALIALFPLGIATAVLVAEQRNWGLFNWVEAHWGIVLLTAVLGTTLSSYWLHRALHAVPLLWRLHRIHHTDTSPDLTTGLRHHPVEHLIMAPAHFATVLVLGLPMWAALLAQSLLLAGALFKHLDGELPHWMEKRAGLVIATPTLHRYHHSSLHTETDSNYGNLLIVWDRLFGTFTQPQPGGPKRIGLGARFDAGSDSFLAQLLVAFRDPPATAAKATPKVGEKSQHKV